MAADVRKHPCSPPGRKTFVRQTQRIADGGSEKTADERFGPREILSAAGPRQMLSAGLQQILSAAGTPEILRVTGPREILCAARR